VKGAIALAVIAFAGIARADGKAADTTWKNLHFLVGTWAAKTTGGAAGATASGSYTFAEDLAGHAITRTTSADTCTGPKAFDCTHHDSLVVYRDGADAIAALYLDSEGHVIRYTVTTPDPHTALFTSVPSPTPAPAFRLLYQLDGKAMTGTFTGAAPGSTEFHAYLTWSGAKQ
jgi:hypothetical protein